jgi:hypothetical protein
MSGWWFFLLCLSLVVVTILIIVIVIYCRDDPQTTMLVAGAGVGDFIEFNFADNVATNTNYFTWKNYTNSLTGHAFFDPFTFPNSTIERYGQITGGNASSVTFFSSPNFNGAFLYMAGSDDLIMASTPQGGPSKSVKCLIVGSSSVGLSASLFTSNIPCNLMQFKTHVGGWQWGWTTFQPMTGPSPSVQEIPFTSQTVWPFVQYYQSWNGSDVPALGFTGPVVTPDPPTDYLLINNYSTTTQPSFYETNYKEDPHEGKAYFFKTTFETYGLDLPDGFILYFPQITNLAKPPAATYLGMGYYKNNVVTSPNVPSTETGDVTIVNVNIEIDSQANAIWTLSKPNGEYVAGSFTRNPFVPVSTTDIMIQGLTNSCPGTFISVTTNNDIQITLVLIYGGRTNAFGITIMPYTATPDPTQNPAYTYAYGVLTVA